MNNHFIPHLEWEAIKFPLELVDLQFENQTFNLSNKVHIQVDRTKDYNFLVVMSGWSENPKLFESDNFLDGSKIIKGQKITGKDENGNEVTLNECFVDTWSTSSNNFNGIEYYFKANILITSLNIVFTNNTKAIKNYDWFICGKTTIHFSNVTIRTSGNFPTKIRRGVDVYDENLLGIKGNYSRDFIKVLIDSELIIVAKVPDEFMPKQMRGICFEYSPIISSELIEDLKDFLSFILGTQLISIGSSKIDENNFLLESHLKRVSLLNLEDHSQRVFPPIHFNVQYDWGNLEWLVENLFPRYRYNRNDLQLDQVLARYFIALKTPIGANLPILANAIEILAANYLKLNGDIDLAYLENSKFLSLIEDELKSLEVKLKPFEGCDIMLRKIKSINQRNPSEKINFFLSLIDIKIGKSEKDALALRNKMVHSVRNYSEEKNALNDVFLTRVYQVLFNRIFLKILGYNDFYIDYSLKDVLAKHISLSAGV